MLPHTEMSRALAGARINELRSRAEDRGTSIAPSAARVRLVSAEVRFRRPRKRRHDS